MDNYIYISLPPLPPGYSLPPTAPFTPPLPPQYTPPSLPTFPPPSPNPEDQNIPRHNTNLNMYPSHLQFHPNYHPDSSPIPTSTSTQVSSHENTTSTSPIPPINHQPPANDTYQLLFSEYNARLKQVFHLEQELKLLQSKEADYKSECSTLKLRESANKNEIEKLISEVQTLKSKLASVSLLQDKDMRCDELLKANEELKIKITTLIIGENKLSGEVRSLQKQVTNLTQKLKKETESYHKAEDKRKSLQNFQEKALVKNLKLEADLESCKAKEKGLEEEIGSQKVEVEKLKEDLKERTSQINSLESKLESCNKEKNELERKNESLTQKVKSLEDQLRNAEAGKFDREREVEKLEDELKISKNRREVNEQSDEELRQKLKQVEEENKSWKRKNQMQCEALETASFKYDQLSEKVKNLMLKTFEEKKELEESFKVKVKRFEDEQNELKNSFDVELAKFDVNLKEAESKIDWLNSQLESLASENNELKDKNKNLLNNIEGLESAKSNLQLANDLEVSNGNSGENRDKLEVEKRNLQEEISILQSKIIDLESDNQNKQDILEAQSIQIVSLKKEKDAIDQELLDALHKGIESSEIIDTLNEKIAENKQKMKIEAETLNYEIKRLNIEKQNDVGKLTTELEDTEARRKNLSDIVDNVHNVLQQKQEELEKALATIESLTEQINSLKGNTPEAKEVYQVIPTENIGECGDNLLEEISEDELAESEPPKPQKKKRSRELEESEESQSERKRQRLDDGNLFSKRVRILDFQKT